MMKEYELYKTYKSLWDKALPAHWKVLPMYAVAEEKSICNCVELPLLSVYLDVGVIPFSYKNEKRTNVTSNDLSKYQRVDPGDFVLNNQQAWRGSVGVSFYNGIVSPAYIVLQMNDLLDSRYANYLLRSQIMIDQFLINSKSVGSIQRNIYWASLKRTSVIVPPHDEQKQIVRFLDWKVSNINKLISNYRLEIELLDKMKQTIIDDAVIKGLNDTPLVHNDDARWEIDYPKHWQIHRSKALFNFRKGLSITKANLEESGIAVISYGQVHSKKNSGLGLNNELVKYVNESYLQTNPGALVEKGDFIFADTSEDITGCGNCVYIDSNETIFAGYHSIVAHPTRIVNNKYFAYLFKSSVWRYQIQKKVNGVKVYSVTQKMLKDTFVLLPPLDEQEKIVSYLDAIYERIDNIIKLMEEKISNLQYLRICLISDVVTGKLDVRNIEIPELEFPYETFCNMVDGIDECENEPPEEV